MAQWFFTAYWYLFNCNEAIEAEIHVIMIGVPMAIQHFDEPIILRLESAMALSILFGNSLDRFAYG